MESTPETYDMLQRDSSFKQLDMNGFLFEDSKLTNLGDGSPIGIAYTQNYAVECQDIGCLIYYPRSEFQNHTETWNQE